MQSLPEGSHFRKRKNLTAPHEGQRQLCRWFRHPHKTGRTLSLVGALSSLLIAPKGRHKARETKIDTTKKRRQFMTFRLILHGRTRSRLVEPIVVDHPILF